MPPPQLSQQSCDQLFPLRLLVALALLIGVRVLRTLLALAGRLVLDRSRERSDFLIRKRGRVLESLVSNGRDLRGSLLVLCHGNTHFPMLHNNDPVKHATPTPPGAQQESCRVIH